jgi:hypothetical protein
MSLRESINGNPAVAGAAVILLLIIAVFVVRGRGTTPYDQGYFYNLSTGELITLDSATLSPVTLPDGNTAVRAYVFSCTACADDRFIGHLERYTDESKQLLGRIDDPSLSDEQRRELNIQIGHGVQIALPPESGAQPQWHPMAAPAGAQIMLHAQQQCASPGQMISCLPNQ